MRARQARFDVGEGQRGQGAEERRDAGRQRRTPPQHPDKRGRNDGTPQRHGGDARPVVLAGHAASLASTLDQLEFRVATSTFYATK